MPYFYFHRPRQPGLDRDKFDHGRSDYPDLGSEEHEDRSSGPIQEDRNEETEEEQLLGLAFELSDVDRIGRTAEPPCCFFVLCHKYRGLPALIVVFFRLLIPAVLRAR